MSINTSLIFFLFFNSFNIVVSNNYISVQINKIDDCLRELNQNNNNLFHFDLGDDLWKCNINIYDYYTNVNGFLKQNIEYEFGDELEFIFEDYYHTDGYMDVNILFNEYIIKTHDQVFWRCTDCGDEHNSDYSYNKDRINFYPEFGDFQTYVQLYHFYFTINDLNDLYKGGKNGAFEVNNNFYSLNSQGTFELTMYDTQNELELINFNIPENFHMTGFDTLPIEFTSYYFKVNYIKVDGTLKGLSINDDIEHDLEEDYQFKVTDLNGLKYVLSDDENQQIQQEGELEVKIDITAYNYCPENPQNNCTSQKVSATTNFIFKIKIIKDPNTHQSNPETDSQKAEESSSQENTDSQKSSSENTDSNPELSQKSSSENTDSNSEESQKSSSENTDSNSEEQKSSSTDNSDSDSQESQKSSSDENIDSDSDSEESTKASSIGNNDSDSQEKEKTSQDNSENSNSIEDNNSSSNKIDKTSSQTLTEETNKEEKTNILEDDFHCLDLDINNVNDDIKNDTYTRLCPNYHINQISNNIIDIIEKIDENKTYKIIGNDFVAQIIPIDSSNENKTDKNLASTSYVNFTECENILRNHYKIYSPRKLTFVQIELNNTNDTILVNQIEYQVFDDKNKMLNLSLCENSTVKVYYTIKNDTQDIIDLISTFKDKDIDILNINDTFYHDVCLPYSDSKKDLTLKDRIQQFYKNYQFCEKNCELEEILSEENMISCNCTIKEESNMTELNFDSSESTINIENQNFKIIECYNAFSALKNNLNNVGFWAFLFLMILNIALLILYCYAQKSFKLYLSQILRKYGYIGENDEGHAFCHNYIKKLDRLIDKLKQEKSKFFQKKGFAPPKKNKSAQKPIKKGKILNTTLVKTKNSRNILLPKKQSKGNKKELETEIKQLKFRMNKTKKKLEMNSNKMSIYKSSKDILVEDKKDKNILKNRIDSDQNYTSKKETNNFNLNLININVNKLNQKEYIPNNSRHVLNIYNFKEAIKYDKRSLCIIYYIFLISKQVILHALFYNSPLEPLAIRLSLLKLILGCDLALNAIFYTDDKVSERYNSSSSIEEFTFTNNLTVILLSTLIGHIIFLFLGFLNNSTNEIRKLFRIEEERIKNNKNYSVSVLRKKEIICEIKNILKEYKIKIIFFYIIEFSLMIFFWYYVTIFCYIYQKTQLSWLLDCLITIIIRIFIDTFINFILSLLYKSSISFNINCLFKTIIFLYCFDY